MIPEMTHHERAEIIISNIISELTTFLMEDTGCTIPEAMDKIYCSHLLQLLQQEEDELYIQSPAYLYQLLQSELQ